MWTLSVSLFVNICGCFSLVTSAMCVSLRLYMCDCPGPQWFPMSIISLMLLALMGGCFLNLEEQEHPGLGKLTLFAGLD